MVSQMEEQNGFEEKRREKDRNFVDRLKSKGSFFCVISVDDDGRRNDGELQIYLKLRLKILLFLVTF